MTEAEAKTKWCPMGRQIHTISNNDIFVGVSSYNRNASDPDLDSRVSRCLASGCMAWRPRPTADPRGGGLLVSGGYCGLAGKP